MTLLNYLLVLAIIVNTFLSGLILIKGRKNPINRNFAFALISIVLWSESLFLSIISAHPFPTRLITASGMLVAYWFLEFVMVYPENSQKYEKLHLPSVLIVCFFFIIALIPSTVVKEVESVRGHMVYQTGPFTIPFAIILYFYLIAVIAILIQKIKSSTGIQRKQIIVMSIGMIPFGLTGITTDLVLPALQIHSFNGLGPIASLFVTISTTIAILRYQALSVRLIVIETFVYILILYLIIELTFSPSILVAIARFLFLILAIIGSRLMVKTMNLEIKQKTELRELDQRKSDFLADIAHRLKTPLAIVRTNLDVVQVADQKDEKKLRYQSLQSAKLAVDRLSRLTTNLIALGKIDFAIDQLVKEYLNLSKLIHETVNDFKPLAGDRQLITKINQSISFNGDPVRLREMVLNLLDNAVKFTDPDKGKIKVSLYQVGEQIRLSVSDNGQGIKAEYIPYLFDRYYQAHNQTKSGSAGIGLAIVQWIVEGHKGKIEVNSEEGKGTRFIINFNLD